MRAIIVRHACAGRKGAWPDDAERPLDRGGWREAESLAGLLLEHAPRRLISSPAVRCTETLEPLSMLTGLPIERCAALGVDGRAALRHAAMHPLAGGAVLCTHGELMRPLLTWLKLRHASIVAPDPSDEGLLRKGTAWLLELDERDPSGRPVLSHLVPHWAPPCSSHVRYARRTRA